MEELIIYKFQAKAIEDALRSAARIFKSQSKTTCVDRDIIESWQYIQNVIDGNIDKEVER
jgi:hypothetical protein